MPIHDWTLVKAGTFHAFHYRWISALCDVFNMGGLPPGYFALPEQVIRGPHPDVLTLQEFPAGAGFAERNGGGIAVATAPPRTRFVQLSEPDAYARKANRITIRHEQGDPVAVIEIVSPGNKNSQHALDTFVNKAAELLDIGLHLLIVDLLPPSVRDPQGIHGAIWAEINNQPFELPRDKPLTLAAYAAGTITTAYVEPVAVADALPDMPLFLSAEKYVLVPLEATYQTTWNVCPTPMKALLEGPAVP